MVEAKALSREFAAHLLASPPRIPRLREAASFEHHGRTVTY
jgi:hypothetical protein